MKLRPPCDGHGQPLLARGYDQNKHYRTRFRYVCADCDHTLGPLEMQHWSEREMAAGRLLNVPYRIRGYRAERRSARWRKTYRDDKRWPQKEATA